MKSKRLLLLLPAAAIAGVVFAQGPLTPAGAPASVMKTLDQIEPRTPISSLPVTLNQSGSYYLAGNLHFTAGLGAAITITVSNVTVDLMGFTLSSSNAVNGDAIRINTGLLNIEVKNGVIAGNTTIAVSGIPPTRTWTVTAAGFNNGINAISFPEAGSCHFSHLRISGCRTMGLNGGTQAIVEQVTATQNGGVGINISTDGSVTNCTAHSNGDDGIYASNGSVANSAASDNDGTGIAGDSIANSRARGNGGSGINGGCVTNCHATGNAGTGIAGASVANSSSTANGSNGIGARTVTNCNASTNAGFGIFSAGGNGSINNCTAYDNGGTGISGATGSVINSSAVFNGDDGISAASGAVAFCRASANNQNSNGSANIDAIGATLTGNNTTP